MVKLDANQWNLVYNVFSFGLISMLACTVYTLVSQARVLPKYRNALVMSSMVTFIAGLAADRAPTRHIPMENSAYSPTFYEFESKALLALYRELDDRDEVPVVIYHSHTSTEAYPSRTDIAYAGEPEAHYVLLSTREEIASRSELRSFRIVDGVVTEEPVEIIGD